MIQKIVQRSPLKYPTVKALSCLNPRLITNSPNDANVRMSSLLCILLEHRWISESVAERCRKQFKSLVLESQTFLKEIFSEWDLDKDSLDSFYSLVLIS